MEQPIKVGVTGGIGSGKSFVCRIIENMGYPIFFSDQVSKDLLANSPEIVSQVKGILGSDAYLAPGVPNKPFIASKIFSNESLLNSINSILHPAVRNSFSEWVEKQSSPIVFNESALLFETENHENFDKIILVIAPKQLKIDRVINRDDVSEEEVIKRMNNQWTDEQKIPLADYIIKNDNEKLLLPQISDIIDDILVDI